MNGALIASMDLISSIFPCVQRRKPLKFPAQEQNGVPPEAEASQASPAASGTVASKSSQRMSIRIVEAVDSQTTICPEEPVNDHDGIQENEKQRPIISPVEERDADSEQGANVKVIYMDLGGAPTATHDRQEQASCKEPQIPTLPPKAAKLPEVKSRMIENIPEEDDGDDDDDFAHADNTTSCEDPTEKSSQEQDSGTPRDAKRSSTWRQSSRKSLVDIINLLQSTTTNNINTLRINSLKWPLPPRSPNRPSTALSCRSSSSLSSSITATVELEKPNPIVKKERRMGAAILPTIRLGVRRWSNDCGNDYGNNTSSTKGPLFCE
ncbi:uncharacterized protein CDV56_105469 [Aspergillus thermomutatus]|uniref:Uncharacterized protein n=1 Tax=Aspergillus thermomutatus TaxID=41047 RepID=A0A397GF36_ASPTH|nr:uncharacterized protein CDV56_105469 [Aspergillus thermomutatus]RHZ49077.1 hypothetical protein CDV56_105469 [Aspergillus thermomutatus]